jgi:glycosyltransferase involved in cell wall biosynthesis
VPPPITVTGSVDDVRPYVARSTVYVVPLQAGGGSRLKILEAFAMGRPVVSTTVGAEGLTVEPERHIVLADTPEAFTTAIIELMDDPARRERLSREALDLVVRSYQWTSIARLQAAVWRDAIQSSPGAHT